MNPELIKQAYAYGAAVALQELGFSAQQAQAGGVKLASEKMAEGEEEAGGDPSVWPAAMFGPLGAAAAAPKGKRFSAYGQTMAGSNLGGAAGTLGGGGLGAGVGALAALLSKGKMKPGMGALLGGTGGSILGGVGGSMYGGAKGYRNALEG